MDLYPFDEEYLRRLLAGKPEVEEHFATHFGGRLRLKLRGRYLASETEDIIQETFVRALETLRTKGLGRPGSLGAFVFAICRHVCRERARLRRLEPVPEE